MIILLAIVVLVWWIWGAIFDPEPNLGRVEKALRHPGRWSTMVIEGWIKDAEEVLKDPASSDEEREAAMLDIDRFSEILGKRA